MNLNAQILQEAEVLKATVADATSSSNEAWVSRQTLQDLYQRLLVMDLEYALDRKVEQDLWNHAFKNQINVLQNQTKDKQNPRRSEVQANLNLFLDTASGFYLQLLQEICSAFKLDLPFRRKSSSIGILKEYGPVAPRIKTPKKSSCMYICQHCLVHLGDIARYRQQIDQAQTYYRHAAHLVPYNGQPYNQQAILEAAKGNKLSTIFYYIRSIAVKHPFPVASTNLEKFYLKISKESWNYPAKLSMSEIISAFLQFHSFIHLSVELDLAQKHVDKIVSSLPSHLTSMSFSTYQLVQLVALNIFALHHCKRKLHSEDNDTSLEEILGKEEQRGYNIVLAFTVQLLESCLGQTPKQEKSKEYHTLPAIKILLDWFCADKQHLTDSVFKASSLWLNLSKLLNNLQYNNINLRDEGAFDPDKYEGMPLPEDIDLQCFLPLQSAHRVLEYHRAAGTGLQSNIETRLRCHRLVEYGLWISEEFSSFAFLSHQRLKSGKILFSCQAVSQNRQTSAEIEDVPEKKTPRQNVAIQAIMQNKTGRNSNNLEEVRSFRIQQKPDPQELSVTDASVAAFSTQDIGPVGGGAPSFGSQNPVSASQAQPYQLPMGQGPMASLLQSGMSGPGAIPLARKYDMNTEPVTGEQPRMILQHDVRPPGPPVGVVGHNLVDTQKPGPSPTHQNPLSADLQQIIHNLPSMNQPPPMIMNPRSQQPQPPYMPAGQSSGLEARSSPTTHGAYQMGQTVPLDFSKPPVSQISQGHPQPASHFSNLVSNSPVFHQTKQAIGQPFQTASSVPQAVRPALTPSRSASNIPTVAETLFGDHGLSVAPAVNPLASIFSHTQPDISDQSDKKFQSTAGVGNGPRLPDLSLLNIKSPAGDIMAGSGFPSFSLQNTEVVPKPDSPPTVPPSNAGSYSLFSHSPWSPNLTISKPDIQPKGPTPAELGIRGIRTPESGHGQTRPRAGERTYIPEQNLAFTGLSYGFGSSDGNWVSPPTSHTPDVSQPNALLSSNIQSLWSSGPSELEKLLAKQQKHTRQDEPPH